MKAASVVRYPGKKTSTVSPKPSAAIVAMSVIVPADAASGSIEGRPAAFSSCDMRGALSVSDRVLRGTNNCCASMTVPRHAGLLRNALVFGRRLEHHTVGELVDEVALDLLPGRPRRQLADGMVLKPA